MNLNLWKENWAESRQRYLDWWAGKGLVLSMWGHIDKEGAPHARAAQAAPASDWNQFWFDPEWRADYLDYTLAHSSFKADMLAVANTHLGPGSLAAILGSELEGGEDTIWIHQRPEQSDALELDENNRWWRLHMDLVRACKQRAQGHYFVGCPDLIEGLDTLASLRGTQPVLLDMIDRPEELERQLQAVNDIWFEVFERIYQEIQVDGEMCFCYFSLWAPGRMAKLQCDLSGMISPRNYRRFVLPYIREQCQKLDYAMYHLDGVDAVRHLDSLLGIQELNAIQWTPGVGQPQGGDPCWYDLYKRIRAAGKAVMPSLVEVSELQPLLDAVGPDGLNILMNFTSERDVEKALEIAAHYR
jgi:hypothetical protein